MLDVSRTTDTVLMVRPYDFGFNEKTGLDNEFQKRPEDVEKLLVANGFKIRRVIHVGALDEQDQFENFIRLRFYEEGILFDTRSSTGKPIYHTNVIMSIGDRFSVICLDCIKDVNQRSRVKTSLEKSFDVIEISMDQMEQHFCGNILQVNSAGGRPLIVMSQRAFNGFTPQQIKRLAQYGKILPMALDTIESVGGGSARCMMAEIFSEKK